jgi:hypothetical protein
MSLGEVLPSMGLLVASLSIENMEPHSLAITYLHILSELFIALCHDI